MRGGRRGRDPDPREDRVPSPCVQRIESRCPEDPDTLAGDPDLQDIVTVNLTRALQLCVDVAAHGIADLGTPPPDSMGEAFTTLAQAGLLSDALASRLRRAVGFRNIAVHNYRAIDWGIVHAIATTTWMTSGSLQG